MMVEGIDQALPTLVDLLYGVAPEEKISNSSLLDLMSFPGQPGDGLRNGP